MNYELTLKDKIYFFFHQSYIDRYGYLYPKVEQHYNNYFNDNNISYPIYYNTFLMTRTNDILRCYMVKEFFEF